MGEGLAEKGRLFLSFRYLPFSLLSSLFPPESPDTQAKLYLFENFQTEFRTLCISGTAC